MEHTLALSKTKILLITGTSFDKEVKEKYESLMSIECKGGLSLGQVLASLKALFNISS